MSAKLSGNFWGEGGFPVVQTFHKTGMKNIEALQAILTERASIESDYVKSLQKLSKKLADISEQGSLNAALVRIREELDSESTQRQQFSSDLKQHASTLAAVHKEVKKSAKGPSGDAEKVNKDYHSLSSNITKAKAKYDKACQDNSANETKVRQEADPKTKAKLESAQVKLQKSQTSAEQEYTASIAKLTGYQPQYEEKLRTAFDSLQECEIQRAEAMKAGADAYCKSLKAVENCVPGAIAAISSAVASINCNSDLEGWITSNKTFTSPPPPPKFEAFGTVSTTTATPATKSSSTSFSSPPVSTPSATSFTQNGGTQATPMTRIVPPSIRPGGSSVPPSPKAPEPEAYQEEYAQEEYGQEEYAEGYGEEYAAEGEEYAPGTGYGEIVTAAWDYDAKESNEISFKAGESITIIAKDDEGWWTGTNAEGYSGLFPANYVNE